MHVPTHSHTPYLHTYVCTHVFTKAIVDKQKDKLEEAIQKMKEAGGESSVLLEETQDPFQVSPQKILGVLDQTYQVSHIGHV